MTQGNADPVARAEIAELRKSLASLAESVNAGFKDVHAGFAKLTASVHEIRASTGPSMRDTLSTVTTGAVLFSAIVGGIIYLARGGNSDKLHELELRLTRIELVVSMATARRPTPSAWVPGTVGR